MIDTNLVANVNAIYGGLGDKILNKHNLVISLIESWEPQVNPGINLVEYASNKYVELTNQILGLYGVEEITKNLDSDNKEAFIEYVEQYTRLFSSLMQFIGLPDFDYSLVASLKEVPSLKNDDAFYLLHTPLHTETSFDLANGTYYSDTLFNVFEDDIPVAAYLTIDLLDTWAAGVQNTDDGIIETIVYPAIVYNMINEVYQRDSSSLPSISTINDTIQNTVTNIINFLTYNDFKQEPVFLEADKKPIPSKADLKTKVYTTHRLRLFRSFCGLTSPEEENTEEITRENLLS